MRACAQCIIMLLMMAALPLKWSEENYMNYSPGVRPAPFCNTCLFCLRLLFTACRADDRQKVRDG